MHAKVIEALIERIGPFAEYDLSADQQTEYMVIPLLEGQGAIRMGAANSQYYEQEWMYRSLYQAITAYAEWSREPGTTPNGWTRYTPPKGEFVYPEELSEE